MMLNCGRKETARRNLDTREENGEKTRHFREEPGNEVNDLHGIAWDAFDRGQTREICEKQEKYFKGKVVTFPVQSLIL